MHGLEPVAGVGKRAPHDGRERIGEIALFQRLAQVDVDRRRRGIGGGGTDLAMSFGLARGLSRGKRGETRLPKANRTPLAAVARARPQRESPKITPF